MVTLPFLKGNKEVFYIIWQGLKATHMIYLQVGLLPADPRLSSFDIVVNQSGFTFCSLGGCRG